MKILRTDGAGEDYANERLKIVRSTLNYFSINHIHLLHDHKGTLTVVWEKLPSVDDKKKIVEIWETMCEYEINHKLLTLSDL
jgi:hypothetical protein